MPTTTCGYRAIFEPGDQRGVVVVTFPDVPEAITEGDGLTEARNNAGAALGLALRAYRRSGRPIPASTKGKGEVIVVGPNVVAELTVR